MQYQSVQISPDGADYITDYSAATVAEVWDLVNDQGSRWYFYPLPFVVTATPGRIERKRIVSACDGFEWLQGCTVHTAMREIAADHARAARERLEYLRGEIRAERISYGEIAELQGLVAHIAPDDVELLEWAGVPEFPEGVTT
jgi:hypothetical protein